MMTGPGDDTTRDGPGRLPSIPGFSDLRRIGSGGFADVYVAYEDEFDREVAIKVLERLEPEAIALFKRERRAAGNLDWHDNIVRVYTTGVTDNQQPYLVMEYLPEGSLAQRFGISASRPMPWEQMPWQEVVSVGVQLSSALGAAHTAKRLHRDVKPANVLQSGDRYKLGDFGIAGLISEIHDVSGASHTGRPFISIGYSSPEAMNPDLPVDHLSDLYSLGATLHVLLSGYTRSARPTNWTAGCDAPAELIVLIEQLTDPDPNARPQSAQAAGQVLQQLQRNHGLTVDELMFERRSRFNAGTSALTTTSGFRRPTQARPASLPPFQPPEETAQEALSEPANRSGESDDHTRRITGHRPNRGTASKPATGRPTNRLVAGSNDSLRAAWDPNGVDTRTRWGSRSTKGPIAAGGTAVPGWAIEEQPAAPSAPTTRSSRSTARLISLGLAVAVVAVSLVVMLVLSR